MKRKAMRSRLLAMLLIVCLVAGLVPVHAEQVGDVVETYTAAVPMRMPTVMFI